MPLNRDLDLLDLSLEMVAHLDRRLTGLDYLGFSSDRDEIDLTAYRLAVIGEATSKLSDGLKSRHSNIPWAMIYKMRNVISHDYPGIDPARTWVAPTRDLAPLAQVCHQELLRPA